jgi:hypothetical protein
MSEQTPLDYVWLSLLMGCFEVGSGSLAQLRSKLENVSPAATHSRLSEEGENHEGSAVNDNVEQWFIDECAEQGINSPRASAIGFYDSSALINSMKPGVWCHVPAQAANGLIAAETSIRASHFNCGARLLVEVLETLMAHCYVCVHPTHAEHFTWGQMEDVLFKLDDCELLPTLLFVKCFRRDYYSRTASGDKVYDALEMAGLWQMAVSAVNRMGGALESRSTLPGRK